MVARARILERADDLMSSAKAFTSSRPPEDVVDLGTFTAMIERPFLVEGAPNTDVLIRALGVAGVVHLAKGDSVLFRASPVQLQKIRERLLSMSRPEADVVVDALDAAANATKRARDLVWPGGRLELSKRAHLMGIVNVTPDSFSDGGRFLEPDDAVKQGVALAQDGADILDVGGESTRPGADPVEAADEIARVVPVIERLAREVDVPISIDTSKADVARAALDAGARILSDVTAGRSDPAMCTLAAEREVPIVLMHMLGEPRTMQQNPTYRDVVGDIAAFLAARAAAARAAGVEAGRILVDPGFGFGKTREHNLVLLRRLRELCCLGYPVMVGTSRKSFIGTTLELPVDERLEGTAATVALAIANGAAVVRVHDVAPMRKVAGMVEAVMRAAPEGGSSAEG